METPPFNKGSDIHCGLKEGEDLNGSLRLLESMTKTLRENSLKDRRISRLGHAQEGQSTLKRFQQQSRDQTFGLCLCY